jgi:hypothetical protein
MSITKIKSAKIENSNFNVTINYSTDEVLRITIGHDPDFSDAETLLKNYPKIFILRIQFTTPSRHLFKMEIIYPLFIRFLEKFKQITQLEIIIQKDGFFETFCFFKHFNTVLSYIKLIILTFDYFIPHTDNKIYKFISKLTFIRHFTIERKAKTHILPDFIELNKILYELNRLPNIRSFHTFDFDFHDNDGHNMACDLYLKENTSLINIIIPQFNQTEAFPARISKRNYERCFKNLISILCSREYEDSLFHKDYLPLDMIKVILDITDLTNLFLYQNNY